MASPRDEPTSHRAGPLGLLWFGIPLFIFAGLWLQRPEVVGTELRSIDWRFRVRGQAGDPPGVVVIAIDDASMQLGQLFDESVFQTNRGLRLMRSQYPWPREVHGILIDRLLRGGARAVALDLLFLNASSYGEEDDAAFESVLARYTGRVVIGANLVINSAQGDAGAATQVFFPLERFIRKTLHGLVNYFPDLDGVIRRVDYEISPEAIEQPLIPEEQRSYRPSFPLQILRAAIGADRADTFRKGRPLIPYLGFGEGRDCGVVSVYPYHFIIEDKSWSQMFRNGELLRDKIVLVGPTAPHFQDKHLTPFGEMKGVEIHAQVVAAALQGLRLAELPPLSWLPLLLACSAVAYTVPRMPHNALLRFAALVAVMAAYAAIAQWLFSSFSLVILLATPLAAMGLVGIGSQAQDFWLEQRERVRLRRTFETHVSKNIADALLSDRHRLQSMLGGVRRPVTILFSDVRDFTSISENARPEELVAQLNEYLSGMVDCILHEGGTLHKFIGDAVMAVWGDTVSGGREEDAQRAVRAALAMFRRLAEMDEKWAAEGRIPMRMGIGINHGEVVVGNIGSTRRMEFTVIGDPVNLASRLEGATKEFRADILIGEDVQPLVRSAFLLRPVGRIQVKGRSKPVNVYEVIGAVGDPSPRITAEAIGTFAAAMTAFYNRRFPGAIALFENFLSHYPHDYLGRSYIDEARRFLDSPPPANWDGTYVMRSK
ncbi:MAG TPA: adenylate/guanylate cyclase domain-containing protein [Verrucomicrobiae bacterium]|nr:adenylate/guanylate cyclase domain-containing protein [Verrucomicrobiae bacterium]